MKNNMRNWRMESVTRDALSALQEAIDALRHENEELQERLLESREEIVQEVGEDIREKYEELLKDAYREKNMWKERYEDSQKIVDDLSKRIEDMEHDTEIRMIALREVLSCTVNGDILNDNSKKFSK